MIPIPIHPLLATTASRILAERSRQAARNRGARLMIMAMTTRMIYPLVMLQAVVVRSDKESRRQEGVVLMLMRKYPSTKGRLGHDGSLLCTPRLLCMDRGRHIQYLRRRRLQLLYTTTNTQELTRNDGRVPH